MINVLRKTRQLLLSPGRFFQQTTRSLRTILENVTFYLIGLSKIHDFDYGFVLRFFS